MLETSTSSRARLAIRWPWKRATLRSFAELMDDHWQHKKKRSAAMSNDDIDRWYDVGMANGAMGGKLVGAGAGGFLLFYAKDQDALRQRHGRRGPHRGPVQFDHDGSTVLVRD